MSSAFRVSAQKGQKRTFLLAGELDLSGVAELVRAVTPSLADPGDITFDLSKLRFVDSTGIRTILDLGRELRGRGRVVLVAPCSAVKRVLDLMGVAGSPQTFDVRDSPETTLA